MTVTFRKHALERIQKRLNGNQQDVARILTSKLYVPIGRDGSSNRIHKLFYSITDDFWFVIVHDEKTDEVMTVLPVDYHNRWEISANILNEAKRKALQRASTQNASDTASASVFRLFAYVHLIDSLAIVRIVYLGSIDRDEYGPEPTDAAEREDVLAIARRRLRAAVDLDKWSVSAFFIRLGQNGNPYEISETIS